MIERLKQWFSAVLAKFTDNTVQHSDDVGVADGPARNDTHG